MELMSTNTGAMVRVPLAVRLPSTVMRVQEPNNADSSVLVKLEDVRALIKSALPPAGCSGRPTLPNSAVNASVLASRRLQGKRRASRPARYRGR